VGIPTEYLVIHSISWKAYPQLKKLQQELQTRLGSLLLEDIFGAMAKHGFHYEPIDAEWGYYAEKGADYLGK
jgi:hypothetical protein